MKKLFFVLLLCFPLFLQAQRITAEEYIETYKDIAMREMREHKIPASITLAQGLLESGCGNSELAREAKNHFGIKCHKGWTGKTYTWLITIYSSQILCTAILQKIIYFLHIIPP